jgi:glycerate-2-kinase
MRKLALSIFENTLKEIEVEKVVHRHLQLQGDCLIIGDQTCDLAGISRIFVIAIGKASLGMAIAVEMILGERLTGGIVVTHDQNQSRLPQKLPIFVGGHPTPNQTSLEAAQITLNLLQEANTKDNLILFLISGGGSAAFEKPCDESLTLADIQAYNQILVGCGAVIEEMNIIRRYFSAVKGGRLAAVAPHARQISLYISDVNEGDLASLASGLTYPSQATLADFSRIIEKYHLLEKFPTSVQNLINSGKISEIPPLDLNYSPIHDLLLDNNQALIKACHIAEQLGFRVEIAEDLIEGEIDEMVQQHLERLLHLGTTYPGQKVCLLSGGEVQCRVQGKGKGGRNQEFVLRCALKIHGQNLDNVVVLSAGTDGKDGNSEADGAIADATTIPRAEQLGLSAQSYLNKSDSFHFFQALDDLIMTGATGNNVRDLRILLRK